jgi:hypothetical protein
MTPKQFAKYLERDRRCYHCGATDETLVPQHRIGRGMGSKNAKAERVSNVIVLCSMLNGLIESDDRWKALALGYGWSLRSWQDPASEGVYDATGDVWWLLDDAFGRRLDTAHEAL